VKDGKDVPYADMLKMTSRDVVACQLFVRETSQFGPGHRVPLELVVQGNDAWLSWGLQNKQDLTKVTSGPDLVYYLFRGLVTND
jgi:hypothetical protein